MTPEEEGRSYTAQMRNCLSGMKTRRCVKAASLGEARDKINRQESWEFVIESLELDAEGGRP